MQQTNKQLQQKRYVKTVNTFTFIKIYFMDQQQKNKAFIINYYNVMSTDFPKTREFLEKYMTDEALIGHIEFFEAAFPGYKVYIDEMTAEGNRVIVQARMAGTHMGDFGEIPPTHKTVDFPFVIKYEIEDNKIVNHWMLADQMVMMQQLGVVPSPEVVH
jgi:predicted ester cyclase